MKKLPIGIEDFKIVSKECYFVDKTILLKEISDAPTNSTFLFTRPLRFGKSLILSMIDCFFAKDEYEKEYFSDYHIYSCKSVMKKAGSYPVIHLNFKNVGKDSFSSIYEDVVSELVRGYSLHRGLLSSSRIGSGDRALLSRLLSREEYASSLLIMTELLEKEYTVRPLVLIDEYDSPMVAEVSREQKENVRNFLSSFYGHALKGNSALGKAVLTGVLRLAKESIFSGLNNLRTSGVLDNNFDEYFGFTDSETQSLLNYYGYGDSFTEVEKWYGGYRFGKQNIFNPWSTLNFISLSGEFESYWVNTSENSILKKKLESEDVSFLKDLNMVMSQEGIYSFADEGIDLNKSGSGLYSLLVSSGYLTVGNKIDLKTYSICLPNREIEFVFKTEILDRYEKKVSFAGLYGFKEALLNENEEKIKTSLETYFLSLLSFYDSLDEKNYQILILVLSGIVFDSNRVRSEVNSGDGRCDIIIYPAKPGSLGIVIELKNAKGALPVSQLKERSKAALKQINKKNYADELQKAGAGKALLYGFAFCKRKIEISSSCIDYTK